MHTMPGKANYINHNKYHHSKSKCHDNMASNGKAIWQHPSQITENHEHKQAEHQRKIFHAFIAYILLNHACNKFI